jgi:site-specific DNA recombinase
LRFRHADLACFRSSRAPNRRNKRQRRHFTFSGLIRCGVCAEENKNFLLVGEIKKGKYVYYRCEECKRLRRASYVREQQIIEAYVSALAELEIDTERLTALIGALDGSDQRRNRTPEAELTRARAELAALQRRLDVAYDDRLTGRIEPAYFNQRASGWRRQIELLVLKIAELEDAVSSTLSEPTKKLELGQLPDFFRKTDDPADRRRIIEMLHSNSNWKEEKLIVKWR